MLNLLSLCYVTHPLTLTVNPQCTDVEANINTYKTCQCTHLKLSVASTWPLAANSESNSNHFTTYFHSFHWEMKASGQQGQIHPSALQ